MDYEEAVDIVVRAGKEGQVHLLTALLQEMNSKKLEEVLQNHGYGVADH